MRNSAQNMKAAAATSIRWVILHIDAGIGEAEAVFHLLARGAQDLVENLRALLFYHRAELVVRLRGERKVAALAHQLVVFEHDLAASDVHRVLIAPYVLDARAVALVGQRADEAADPVEIVGLGVKRDLTQIVRHLRHIRIHRQPRGKRRGAEAYPLDTLDLVRHIASDLADRRHARAVDADGTVDAALFRVPARIGVIWRALIVGRKQILDVLRGDLALGNIGPRDIVALGREVRVFAVPAVGVRREAAAHEPRARRVVDVVHVAVRAEDIPRIELSVLVQIQMILCDEFLQICRAEVRFLRAEGVLKVERVHAELVRIDDDAILGNFLRDPVVAANGLEPPDLVFVVESDAVRLIGAVLL